MSRCLVMVVGSVTSRFTLTKKALSLFGDADQWFVAVNGEKVHHYRVMRCNRTNKNSNIIIALSIIHSPSQWGRYVRSLGYVIASTGAVLSETKLYHDSMVSFRSH